MIGFRLQGAVQRDDVRLAEEIVQRDIARAGREQIGIVEDIIGQHLAAEAQQDPGDDRADLAGADHAGRAAVEFQAHQALQGEVALADAVVGLVDLAVQGQDQGQRVLGHGMGRIGRHASDRQPHVLGNLQIDLIEARTAEGDQPRALLHERQEHVGVERIVDEGAHGRKTGGQGAGLAGQAGFEEHQLVARRGVGRLKKGPIVGFRAEDGDFHRIDFTAFQRFAKLVGKLVLIALT